MQPIRFIYRTELRVRLTREELTTLRAVCARHYDYAVRALSLPGTGAVLNGAATRMDVDETETEAEFTYRQLDTLAKGLEGAASGAEHELAMRVWRLLAVLRAEEQRVNDDDKQPTSMWWAERVEGS